MQIRISMVPMKLTSSTRLSTPNSGPLLEGIVISST